jgi:GNAT superfamily N-acetyltransferase
MAELRAEVMRADLERLGRWDPVRVRQRFLDAFDPANTFVIQVDADDAGLIAVRRADDGQWFEHFYLRPSHQGSGIGGEVLRHLMRVKRDGRPFRIDVLQGSRARRLYERHGFVFEREDQIDVFLVAAPESSSYLIRYIEPADAAAWVKLYNGYREFYGLQADDEAVATTWAWMIGREFGLRGIVAADEQGQVIALANLRLFARPSVGKMGLYLDDLFTAPSSRGSGAAGALLKRAAQIAAEEGATVVRWITAGDNSAARSVYDAHATATPWVTYDMAPKD